MLFHGTLKECGWEEGAARPGAASTGHPSLHNLGGVGGRGASLLMAKFGNGAWQSGEGGHGGRQTRFSLSFTFPTQPMLLLLGKHIDCGTAQMWTWVLIGSWRLVTCESVVWCLCLFVCVRPCVLMTCSDWLTLPSTKNGCDRLQCPCHSNKYVFLKAVELFLVRGFCNLSFWTLYIVTINVKFTHVLDWPI